MTHIDKETLKQLNCLSSEDVAEKLGLEIHRHKARCFMHDDHNPSLSFYGPNHALWKCFVCDIGGNAIQLVMKRLELNFTDACFWLCQQYGIGRVYNLPNIRYKIKSYQIETSTQTFAKIDFNAEIASFILQMASMTNRAERFLFQERKFKKHVIETLHIKALESPSEIMPKLLGEFDIDSLLKSGFVKETNGKFYLRYITPCLLFPYYDTSHNLISLQARYLGDNRHFPRFQFTPGCKSHLFNLPILSQIKKGDELFIAEGVTDCLALLSSGINAIALPSATNIPIDELMDLKEFNLNMYPDTDNAGGNAFTELRSLYINLGTRIHKKILPDGCKDYCDYYILKQENDVR